MAATCHAAAAGVWCGGSAESGSGGDSVGPANRSSLFPVVYAAAADAMVAGGRAYDARALAELLVVCGAMFSGVSDAAELSGKRRLFCR